MEYSVQYAMLTDHELHSEERRSKRLEMCLKKIHEEETDANATGGRGDRGGRISII